MIGRAQARPQWVSYWRYDGGHESIIEGLVWIDALGRSQAHKDLSFEDHFYVKTMLEENPGGIMKGTYIVAPTDGSVQIMKQSEFDARYMHIPVTGKRYEQMALDLGVD